MTETQVPERDRRVQPIYVGDPGAEGLQVKGHHFHAGLTR